MLTIEKAHSPEYGNTDKTHIVLTVKFAEFEEEMPFGATPFDSMPYGVDLYNRAIAGEFGNIVDYIPPPKAENQPTVLGAQEL